MNVFIVGGTGFLGRAVTREMLRLNHMIVLLTRDPQRAELLFPPALRIERWNGVSVGSWLKYLDGVDAVINLTGEPIDGKRWSPAQKDLITSSRVHATRAIVEAIGKVKRKPRVLINASAVGYYGNVAQGDVTEKSARGKDFLAGVCEAWEQEAKKAEKMKVRVVLLRTGIVLSQYGGALRKLLLPFRFFVGGPLGPGTQWFPWIHLEDELAAIVYVMHNRKISGPVNLSAPESVTMKQFCSTLGKALHRPSLLRVPAPVLKIALGEMAEALLLNGQRVIPEKLLDAGFQFQFPTLRGALRNILYPELDFIERGF